MCSDHFVSGKPAALYERSSVDWVPSLYMGYNNDVNTTQRSLQGPRYNFFVGGLIKMQNLPPTMVGRRRKFWFLDPVKLPFKQF